MMRSLLLLALLCACGRSPAATSSSSVVVRTEGGFRFDYEVTEAGESLRRSVRLGPGVEFVYSSGTVFISSGASAPAVREDGLFLGDGQVECRGDELLLAGRSYGPLDDDAAIELLVEGVLVDGERRGDLPLPPGAGD